LDWKRIREEVHDEHERATTTAERVALLSIHKALLDKVERDTDFAPEDLETFKTTRRQDYNLLLIQEAIIGRDVADTNIDPQKLAVITEREVKAGRMTANDDLHKLAVAGAAILTPFPKPQRSRYGWLRLWMVLSVLWGAGVMATALKDKSIPSLTKGCSTLLKFRVDRTGEYLGPDDVAKCEASWREERMTLAAWSLGPPLVLLVIGLLISWIARGFRPPQNKPHDAH
jgi:hypothetical protein